MEPKANTEHVITMLYPRLLLSTIQVLRLYSNPDCMVGHDDGTQGEYRTCYHNAVPAPASIHYSGTQIVLKFRLYGRLG